MERNLIIILFDLPLNESKEEVFSFPQGCVAIFQEHFHKNDNNRSTTPLFSRLIKMMCVCVIHTSYIYIISIIMKYVLWLIYMCDITLYITYIILPIYSHTYTYRYIYIHTYSFNTPNYLWNYFLILYISSTGKHKEFENLPQVPPHWCEIGILKFKIQNQSY